MSAKTVKKVKTPAPDSDKDKDTDVVLDLASFVTEVERFSSLIEPFAFVFYLVDDLRRWRFPNSTIALWLACNFCCLILTQGAVFILMSVVVIGIATVCLCQLHTRILDKYLPKTKKEIQVKRPSEEINTLETIQNFRYSLIQMHDFVIKSNEYLTYVYAVLKWDDTVPAIIYHTEVCTCLLSLVILPVRWNCILFVNWFFLCHPEILKKGYQYWAKILQSSESQKNQVNGVISSAPAQDAKTSSVTAANKTEAQLTNNVSAADLDSLNGDDKDDKDDSSDVDLLEISNAADESLTKLEPSPQRPGMVARLLELKKRRTQMANENCFGCKVSFSSILKRRHYCRHCGNSYCHKCCNQKVPRSVFGATSPAASKETVLVCSACHALLTGPSESTSSQAHKSRGDTN